MRIEMRGPEPGVENAADLAQQFIVDADAAEGHGAYELSHGSRKRRLTHQNQMNADIERGIFASEARGVVERRAGRHQRGGGEDALPTGLDDTLVDIAPATEIVRVYF